MRQKFSEQGHLTDVQLKYDKDGKFRQFAFVGYSTEEEAKRAISYFDKSFFKSSRIIVEPCAQIGNVLTDTRVRSVIFFTVYFTNVQEMKVNPGLGVNTHPTARLSRNYTLQRRRPKAMRHRRRRNRKQSIL